MSICPEPVIRLLPLAGLILFSWMGPARCPAETVTLMSEAFEGLALGPALDESNTTGRVNVWTKDAPLGWTLDDSQVPGVGDGARDGVTEWAGWSFADADFWVTVAHDQQRSQFRKASGTIAVADPDEWDDQSHAPWPDQQSSLYHTFMSTRIIPLIHIEVESLSLKFDSSWRPEDTQSANLVALFGDTQVELFRWLSIPGPHFKTDASNETVVISARRNNQILGVPLAVAGKKYMVLQFGLFDAGNDWWWAIDNIELTATANSVGNLLIVSQAMETLRLHEDGADGPRSAALTLALQLRPSAPVIVTVDPEGVRGDVVLSASQGHLLQDDTLALTFTADNWHQPQTVTITAIADGLQEGPESGPILFATDSAEDARFRKGYVGDYVVVDVHDGDLRDAVLAVDRVAIKFSPQDPESVLAETVTLSLTNVGTDPLQFQATIQEDPLGEFRVLPSSEQTLAGGASMVLETTWHPLAEPLGLHQARLRITGDTLALQTEPIDIRLFGRIRPKMDRRRHVLVIGIDGVRSDALLVADTPNMDALIAEGAVSYTAYAGGELGQVTQQATSSGPGWSSMLTGVWVNKHRVNNNAFSNPNYARYPHMFTRIKESYPDAYLASIVQWAPINTHIVPDADTDLKSTGSGASVAAQAIRLLQTQDPIVTFLHFDDVDHAGHGTGYHPEMAAYTHAISVVDQHIGAVMDAVAARPEYEDEEWLVLVSTDHGGRNRGHGGQSWEERTIFIIASGPSVCIQAFAEGPGHVAIPPTVMRHLGIDVDPAWAWEAAAFAEHCSRN